MKQIILSIPEFSTHEEARLVLQQSLKQVVSTIQKEFSSKQLNATGLTVVNVQDPVLPQDAATKAYVDSVASGDLPSLKEFVEGASALRDPGAIPMVKTPGVLEESELVDNGLGAVTLTALVPSYTLATTGGTKPARFFKYVDDASVGMSLNLSYDGANWNLDDTSTAGILVQLISGSLAIHNATAGSNPRTLTTIFGVSNVGDVNSVAGVYKVAGTQVVGARLGTISYGGGIAGGTYTAAEQALLNNLISAMTAVISRLQTHGLIA